MFLVLVVTLGLAAQSWPENLVSNPGADGIVGPWQFFGQAAIEGVGPTAHFVARNGGEIHQFIRLPPSAAGQFLLITGRGSGERVHTGSGITDLPYLYALVIADDRVKILLYAQGQQMRARYTEPDTWVRMAGVFRVPDGAAGLSLQLRQASGREGRDGSAARFDDLGVYLLPTEAHARALLSGLDPDPRPWLDVDLDQLEPPLHAGAFPGASGVVLPETDALLLIPQCSRRSPAPVEGIWLPDAEVIGRLEARLAPLLEAALEHAGVETRPPSTAYYRQYAGLVVNGRRVVYVNGFAVGPNGPPPDWHTRPVRVCDGGVRAFGVEFDAGTGQFDHFRFNSNR